MVVRLVPAAQATRLQEDGVEVLGGVTLPRIDVPERAIEAAIAIVAARLGLAPFA
jgi:hypothetical protein